MSPDHARVITRFFVPGREDVGPGDSRAGPVIERILELDERDVDAAMRDDRRPLRRPAPGAPRHLRRPRSPGGVTDSTRRAVLHRGAAAAARCASFTHEYAIEGAALCNPSIVLHPDQPGNGDPAFVLSVRGIGEGHRSSIGFRTGTVTASGTVTVDAPGPFPADGHRPSTGTPSPSGRLHAKLAELDDDHENAAYVLDPLPPEFDDADLDARVDALVADAATRRHTTTTIAHLRVLARCSYRVEFPSSTELSERVLWPHAPAERHGMEDARFVRFVDDGRDRPPTTRPTPRSTASTSPSTSSPPTTSASFTSSPMAGSAATGKGLALFPRRIDGRYVALSRSDRETNSIAFSDDLRCWDESYTIQTPARAWEILQLGNCGSPIETAAGWLVLTHGVGPMRTYSLGAILLDLDDPRRVIAESDGPILSPVGSTATATSPTSCTPAERWRRTIFWSCPTASVTRPSRSPRCRSTSSSARCGRLRHHLSLLSLRA